LYDFLNKWQDTKVIAGDYSAYDSKIPIAISYAVLDIIEAYYYNSTVEDRDTRRILFLEIVNSLHIRNGVVYEFLGGNPSGQPMTAVFNSIANIFMLLIVIRYLEQDLDIQTIYNNVNLTTFGDDHIIAINPNAFSNLTQDKFAEGMKAIFDYDYTNEKKDGKVYILRDLDQVSFLKRGFRKAGVHVYPPLELDVIKETLNHVRQGWNTEEFRLRVKAVMKELAYHGADVFNAHAPKILKLWYENFPEVIEENTYDSALQGEHTLSYQ